jgi:hypothetical protein
VYALEKPNERKPTYTYVMAASAMSFSAACAGARVAGAASSSGSRSRSTAKATMGGRSARVVAVKAASATGARKELAGGLQQSGVARAKRAQRGKVSARTHARDENPGMKNDARLTSKR